jgi:hypothetical protein
MWQLTQRAVLALMLCASPVRAGNTVVPKTEGPPASDVVAPAENSPASMFWDDLGDKRQYVEAVPGAVVEGLMQAWPQLEQQGWELRESVAIRVADDLMAFEKRDGTRSLVKLNEGSTRDMPKLKVFSGRDLEFIFAAVPAFQRERSGYGLKSYMAFIDEFRHSPQVIFMDLGLYTRTGLLLDGETIPSLTVVFATGGSMLVRDSAAPRKRDVSDRR